MTELLWITISILLKIIKQISELGIKAILTCLGCPSRPPMVVEITWPASVPFPSTTDGTISCKKTYIVKPRIPR